MQFVVIDFESFYTREPDARYPHEPKYSLNYMTTEAYVRDPRFEAHGAAIKWGPSHEARWYDGRQLKFVLRENDWSDTMIIAHHFQFDGLILSHHYGVKPKMRGCTLSMARLMLGNHIGVSLDSVRKQFNIPAKTTPYNLFVGKHWHEMVPAVQEQIAAGACDEAESIWQIFGLLLQQGFPREELDVIDSTMQMFTEPVLGADIDLLGKVWRSENDRKAQRLAELEVTATELQSADKFAALLRAEGVEPKTKDGKKGPIYAFAKTDQFMQDLLEDEDDRVRILAEARLGEKSTILQTRAATLGWMARRGPLCVYLRYAGAGTLRFSGGDRSNFQNFKRKDEDSPKEASPLRRSILAPEGYLLAPIDLSQIECRTESYLAGQEDALEEFRRGDDPYIKLASEAYGYPVTPAMKAERGTGKQLKLSCGYMAAEHTIQKTARLGIYGPPVIIDLATALRWKNVYRNAHPRIVDYWKTANRMIARIAGGPPLDWGPLHIENHRIYLPNGAPLIYDTLEYHVPTEEEKEKLKPIEHEGYWRLRTRHGWKTLHGGKLTQNICEAVSRVIVTQAMLRIKHKYGWRTLNIPHDELLILLPKNSEAEKNLQLCLDEMKQTPDWLPGLPLDAEGELGDRYSK